MRKSTLLIVLCFVFGVLFAPNLQAQENEAPTMFLVWEEFVPPANMPMFWKAQSEALTKFDELNLTQTFSAYRTNQNSYYWVIPIENFASIDKLYVEMMGNQKALKENGYDPAEKFRDLSTTSQFVISWNQELSYNPNPPAADTEHDKFHKWRLTYIKSGHEKEAAAAIKAYQKFYDSIDDSYSWNIYEVVFGQNTPCWIFHVSGDSEMVLLQKENALQEKYGKDFQKLYREVRSHFRDTKYVKGWYLPNWSRDK